MIESHKHCIYCGEVIDPNYYTPCNSPLNRLPVNTLGIRSHSWLQSAGDDDPTSGVFDLTEKAPQA